MRLLLALLSVSWAAAPVRVQPQRAPLGTPVVAVPLAPAAAVRLALTFPGTVGSHGIVPQAAFSPLPALPAAVAAPQARAEAQPQAQALSAALPQARAALPTESANDASYEQRAAEAGKTFDNAAPKTPAVEPPGGGGPPSDGVPSYLSVPAPEDRAWVAAVFAAAAQSPAARRVLARVEKLAKTQGRPLTLVVLDLRTNNGEYVYDWEVVRMASSFRKLDPGFAAPIVIHELLHALQKADGLPVDAVELELEAHLVTLRVMRELGIPAMPGSFEEGAYKALRKSAAKYVKFVSDSYDNNRGIFEGGVKEYLKWLQGSRAKAAKRVARLEKQLARERGIVDAMKATGQPAELVSKYEREIVGGLELKLLVERNGLAWNERDLKILSSPEGAARYRAFASRVRRMIREGRSVFLKP